MYHFGAQLKNLKFWKLLGKTDQLSQMTAQFTLSLFSKTWIKEKYYLFKWTLLWSTTKIIFDLFQFVFKAKRKLINEEKIEFLTVMTPILFFYNIKTGLAEWKHVQVRISPQKSLVNEGFAEHYWSANVVGTHGVSNHYTSLIPDRKPVGSM